MYGTHMDTRYIMRAHVRTSTGLGKKMMVVWGARADDKKGPFLALGRRRRRGTEAADKTSCLLNSAQRSAAGIASLLASVYFGICPLDKGRPAAAAGCGPPARDGS